MFLSKSAIACAVETGAVTIDPFDPTRLTGASYVFGVGLDMLEVEAAPDGEGFSYASRAVELTDGAWTLEPGRLDLAATDCRIGSDRYAMRLVGRPALGHIGLFLQISADLGHQGARHAWTLEIVATRPTRLAPPTSVAKRIDQALKASLRAVPAAFKVDEHVVVDVVVGGYAADFAYRRDNDLRALREVDYRRGKAEGVPGVVVVAHPGHVWVPQGDDHEAWLGRRDRLEGALLVEEGSAPGESLLNGRERGAP